MISKKLSAAAAGALALPFVVPPEYGVHGVWIAIAYIVTQGVVDVVKAWKGAA